MFILFFSVGFMLGSFDHVSQFFLLICQFMICSSLFSEPQVLSSTMKQNGSPQMHKWGSFIIINNSTSMQVQSTCV